MQMPTNAREIVMAYVQAMDKRDYAAVRQCLQDSVFIRGPGGEAFRSPDEFLRMMEQQRGRYDIRKVFVDGDDVCLLYNFVTDEATVFFCSWYQVKAGKIASIETIFDPRAFDPG
jgi:hypothetical protein